MTSDFHDREIERDDTLIKGLYSAARTTRQELREWVQAELKAILIEAELQEKIAEGELRDRIKNTVVRLRTINQGDLPEAVSNYDGVMVEVLQGGFQDVHDAYDQLQQGCAGLVRIMRELLEIRSFIGGMGDA